MARRVCGRCGAKADEMIVWNGQTIAICGTCQGKLDTEAIDRRCAFEEAPFHKLRPVLAVPRLQQPKSPEASEGADFAGQDAPDVPRKTEEVELESGPARLWNRLRGR
jgi:hypothetical protein